MSNVLKKLNENRYTPIQESIPVGCLPSAFLVPGGGVWSTLLDADTPDADPLDAGHVTCDAYWEANPLWTDRQV